MGITAQKFDFDRIATLTRLFSDDIDTDPWVMFHGTSGFNAEAIEREGLTFQRGFVTQDHIKRVTHIYEVMKWSGESGGGYPVLKPFSLDHDFVDDGKGLLFFCRNQSESTIVRNS
jgi:hypothetical protein